MREVILIHEVIDFSINKVHYEVTAVGGFKRIFYAYPRTANINGKEYLLHEGFTEEEKDFVLTNYPQKDVSGKVKVHTTKIHLEEELKALLKYYNRL